MFSDSNIELQKSHIEDFYQMPKYGIAKYEREVSSPISENDINRHREGWAVRDVNGDYIPDLIIANAGDPLRPVQSDDPPVTVMLSNKEYQYSLANTDALQPPGWINDFVFIDSDKDGYSEIIAIDHGREIPSDDPDQHHEPLGVYEFDPTSETFMDRTDEARGNSPGFYHNASSTADLNNDGLNDFFVSQMGPTGFRIFTGDEESIIRDASREILADRYDPLMTYAARDYTTSGAAVMLDYGGDGDYDAVTLPYKLGHGGATARIFEFENGALETDFVFDSRNGDDFELPGDWGYSFARVRDVNGDGLSDIIAHAENPTLSVPRGTFVTMTQKPTGGFTVSKAFPDQPLSTDREAQVQAGINGMIHKFRLDDLDGDGDPDLYWGENMALTSETMKTGLFFNDGTGHFYRNMEKAEEITGQIEWASGSATRTFMQDINADGIGDFFALTTTWGESAVGETTVSTYLSQSQIAANKDEVAFGDIRSRYQIKQNGESITASDRLGNDTPRSIPETGRLHFQDISLAFDPEGHAAAALRLYNATFGRTADSEGLGYWVDRLDDGTHLERAAAEFIGSPEFTERYGASPTNADYINALYTNVLGRSPDPEGNEYWLDRLETDLGRDDVLSHFSESEENLANTQDLIAAGIEYVAWDSEAMA